MNLLKLFRSKREIELAERVQFLEGRVKYLQTQYDLLMHSTRCLLNELEREKRNLLNLRQLEPTDDPFHAAPDFMGEDC